MRRPTLKLEQHRTWFERESDIVKIYIAVAISRVFGIGRSNIIFLEKCVIFSSDKNSGKLGEASLKIEQLD